MPKFRVTRRAAALAVATLALAGSTAIGVSSTAQAAPASCTVSDLGYPGRITVNGYYAGEVEQQYDGCGNVRAHFQYDHGYWTTHAGTYYSASPCVQTLDYHGQACATGDTVDGPQDVYSGWVPIHSASPDWWQAIVTIPAACGEAGGSWHDYGTGNNWGDYASC